MKSADRRGTGPVQRGPHTSTLIFAEAMPLNMGEHPLNWLAATVSSPKLRLCHVELSIGSAAGSGGAIGNVLRVYSGETVELCQRTGLNPSLKYVEITHSAAAEQAMLQFARDQQGKPFSMSAMARSPCIPRTTSEDSWYCAELTAAALKAGGLLSKETNPASHTPQTLYVHFSERGAPTANPYILRKMMSGGPRLQIREQRANTERCPGKREEAAETAASPAGPQPDCLHRGADDMLRAAVRNSGVLLRHGSSGVGGLYDPLK